MSPTHTPRTTFGDGNERAAARAAGPAASPPPRLWTPPPGEPRRALPAPVPPHLPWAQMRNPAWEGRLETPCHPPWLGGVHAGERLPALPTDPAGSRVPLQVLCPPSGCGRISPGTGLRTGGGTRCRGGFEVPVVLEPSYGPGGSKREDKVFFNFFFFHQEAASLDRSKDAKTAREVEGG